MNVEAKKDIPVICAECRDTGKIIEQKGVRYLSCGLLENKVIYGSKPKWCPKGSIFEAERGSK